MLTLAQSATARGSAGEPLPTVWQRLADTGTKFLRGQLALIAAGPGTGKSAFVLSYALRAGVSTMYFSADSDAYVQLSRSLAILGEINLTEATDMALSDEYDKITEIVGEVPVRFSYDPSPTLRHIEKSIVAYDELYGDYPELIVVDNALDVVLDDTDDGAQALDDLMAWLHDLARTTGACVIVLHHVTGPFNDADKPIPLSGVKGQIGRVPELILTLHKHTNEIGPDTLCVSTVKNRGNKADPSGNTFIELEFIGDEMKISDNTSTETGRYDIWQ